MLLLPVHRAEGVGVKQPSPVNNHLVWGRKRSRAASCSSGAHAPENAPTIANRQPQSSATPQIGVTTSALAYPAIIPPEPAMAAPPVPSFPGASGPIPFPAPSFGVAYKILSKTLSSKISSSPSFILVSQSTQRTWKTIKAVRECQFGEVHLAVETTERGDGAAGAYFAIKELSMAKMVDMRGRTHEDPLREVAALQCLSEHPNVLLCTEALRDSDRIYIVSPFCSGGEAFDVLTEKGRFTEAEAKPFFRQVLDALLHLKRHGMCHRDVSLENLLMDEDNRVRLIDLGLALRIPLLPDGRSRVLLPQGPCGKQHYIAPEVLASGGFEGFAVDVWACGVLLFVLVAGVPPFELALPSQDRRCHVIAVEERLQDLLSAWKMPLSAEVMDLIQSCLIHAPERRATLEQLRTHPWVNT